MGFLRSLCALLVALLSGIYVLKSKYTIPCTVFMFNPQKWNDLNCDLTDHYYGGPAAILCKHTPIPVGNCK